MQGVSINLFIKTGKKKANELGNILHFDVFGKREFKYNFLFENTLNDIPCKVLENISPNYFFVPKNLGLQAVYEDGFAIVDLAILNNMGITSGNDFDYVSFEKHELLKKFGEYYLKKISYRPFDERYLYYDQNKLARARFSFMKHLMQPNIGLSLIRRSRSDSFVGCVLIKNIADKCISSTLDNANIFPLYVYTEKTTQTALDQTTRTPNLNPAIVQQIADKIGLHFTNEKEADAGTFAPIDILDYIYAVLHWPTYRETYKEFLKIDFPRVPYPKDAPTFWALVALGSELRQIHLLESPKVEKYITQYPIDGNNIVEKVKYDQGKVYINDTQYFANVPPIAWEFYIGGYQPAQKWLKDRKGGNWVFEDILHYQKIIVALTETDRIMKEIDKIQFF